MRRDENTRPRALDFNFALRLSLVVEQGTAKRHGCLTAYLIFVLIINTLACIVYLVLGDHLSASYPSAPPGSNYVLAFGSTLNVVLVAFLFWWKKWAFYGLCLLAVATLIIDIFYIGANSVGALTELIAPVVLFAVLQIGGDRKGWRFLK